MDDDNDKTKLVTDDSKLVILTGGNSGIGLAACKLLCAEGHRVIATVRTAEKGDMCIRDVKGVCDGADIHYMICDMSDPSSIRRFAGEFQSKWLTDGQYLDILVNNAGVSPGAEKMLCEHNPTWEIAMATNCLGPVLLTDLLMDNLKTTAAVKGESRVVMVSSSIVLMDKYLTYQTDPHDLMMNKPAIYKNGGQAYKNSKVALMMSTLAMVDELQGSNVKINSMCPGIVPETNIARHTSSCQQSCFRCLALCCLRCCMKPSTIQQGGNCIVQLAVKERGESNGLFFVKGNMKEAPPQCQDKENQRLAIAEVRKLVAM